MLFKSKKHKGDHYETIACRYLTRQGLVLLDKNSHSQRGEVDLVMRDDNCLVFVEVRYRQSSQFGGAGASITRTKQQRLYHAAQYWMASNGYSGTHTEYRFDAVTIDGTPSAINWIKNIVTEGF